MALAGTDPRSERATTWLGRKPAEAVATSAAVSDASGSPTSAISTTDARAKSSAPSHCPNPFG